MIKEFKDPFLTIMPHLDVHGSYRDTVWYYVDNFINENYCTGKSKIYVIHGKSGNTLREEIHKHLKKDKRVSRFYLYMYNTGITIIELEKNN